jgi:hypothetical protein
VRRRIPETFKKEVMNDLQKTETPLPAVSGPMDMIMQAVNSGASIETLERLMALKQQHDAEVAKKAFTEALSKFQEECPEIRKMKSVEFNGKKAYDYAPLPDIERQIKPLMVKHGFTKSWENTYPGNGKTRVTCVLTHIGGHSTRTDMDVEPDKSGGKNAIQADGSSITFARRYTLTGALGISTADQDIDGRMPELDVDKLHVQYMELYNKIVEKDSSFYTLGSPDNWKAERTAKLYVAAIGKAREILTKLTKEKP